VVEGLFEPICRDFQLVTREIERMPAGGEITSHDLVARIDDAVLGDIEDALAELVDRGVLSRERDKYRWAESPRDLGAFHDDCAWSPMAQYQSLIS
jgi:hypothetical protein